MKCNGYFQGSNSSSDDVNSHCSELENQYIDEDTKLEPGKPDTDDDLEAITKTNLESEQAEADIYPDRVADYYHQLAANAVVDSEENVDTDLEQDNCALDVCHDLDHTTVDDLETFYDDEEHCYAALAGDGRDLDLNEEHEDDIEIEDAYFLDDFEAVELYDEALAYAMEETEGLWYESGEEGY